MPYDWYDYQRKVTGDETMKESSDYVRENLWRETQDVTKAQTWMKTEDKILMKLYHKLRG